MSTELSTSVNFDKMSLEELKAAANAELAANPNALPTVSAVPGSQPRDPESGQFVAQNPPEEGVSVQVPAEPEVEPEPEEELDPAEVIHNEELVYRLEVPGEDGSGSEVFYGHGPDFLTRYRDAVEQLRQSKIHANRKIRSMTKEQKAITQMTEDERFVLKKRLETEPEVAIDEIIARRLAADPRIKAAERVSESQAINDVTNEWVAQNPDFYANEANGKKMWQQMRLDGVVGVPTLAQITAAYTNLAGLLQVKPAAPPQVVTAPATPAPPARRGSGLPARSAVVVEPVVRANVVPGTNHTEAELAGMTLDQLRQLAGGQKTSW